VALLVLVGVAVYLAGDPLPVRAQTVIATYPFIASEGVALPGGLRSTNSPSAAEVTVTAGGGEHGRTLLATRGGGQPVSWRFEGTVEGPVLLGVAVQNADYPSPTSIAAGVTGYFALEGGAAQWRFELLDIASAGGQVTTLAQATVSRPATGAPAGPVRVVWPTPRLIQLPGHRLAVRVLITPAAPGAHALHFNQGGADATRLELVETTDTTAPTSFLSVSPVAPDGDGEWFRSPATVVLTAADPDAWPLVLYRWNEGRDTLYTSMFAAPIGHSVLRFYAVDSFGNREQERTFTFAVDPDLVPPDLLSPQGGEDRPQTVSGPVAVRARGFDTNSGMQRVAFYAFPRTLTGWAAVGEEVGPDQTAPVAEDEYEVIWRTSLLRDGPYKLQAQLRDRAGNTGWSQPQYVRVQNLPASSGADETTATPSGARTGTTGPLP